jgi:hypothetical protein
VLLVQVLDAPLQLLVCFDGRELSGEARKEGELGGDEREGLLVPAG